MNVLIPLIRRTLLPGLALATVWAGLTLSVGATPLGSPEPTTHTILTANIRVALPRDDATGNGWKTRRQFCADLIRSRQPDIICLQEVLREQLEDLRVSWPEFETLGFEGPEMDTKDGGYHGIAKNPIFYQRDRYELMAAGGFWLSETPHLPGSLSWGSARARSVNWVRLRERETGIEFRVVNTHLDHLSQSAREGQVGLILEESAAYAPDFPQLLAGDFNVDMANAVVSAIEEAGWVDTYAAVHGPDDPGFTAHAFRGADFRPSSSQRQVGKVDFIFQRGPLRPVAAEIITDHRDGQFPSDHFFVSAQVTFD